MTIAHGAGYPHIRHMAAELTSSEITELAAWHILEPDVGRRIDEGFASLLTLVYNRTRGKKDRAMRADEFMPQRGPVEQVSQKTLARKWSDQWGLMKQIDRIKRKRKNG